MLSRVFVKDTEFYRSLLKVALPIVAMNVITIGVNMMDTIMLGSFGEVQLSGSSLANDFINIFQILCMGMGCGAAVLTAQFYGSKNMKSLRDTITIMLRVSLVIGLTFTLIVCFFSKNIMSIYTKDADVIEKGSLYFMWSLPTFLLMGISLPLTQILRSIKDVKISLIASIVSFFTNIFFNWVFIFGNLGMPKMEIAGAAVGTVIARIAETSIIAVYFFLKEKNVCYRIKCIFSNVDGSLFSRYFHYSLPVLISDSLLGFGNSAVSVVIGHMGTSYTAAYAIVAMIQRLSTVFTGGIGQAAHTLTGNRIGEGKKKQAYDEAITLLATAGIIGIISALFIAFSGEWIASFYNISAETHEILIGMNDAMAIMVIFQALQSVITKGILRGGGDTMFALGIDAVFLWVVSVPLGIITGLVLHMDAFWVLIALKIDWMIKSILGTIRIISGKWIKEIDAE